jgi:hypothetical protein
MIEWLVYAIMAYGATKAVIAGLGPALEDTQQLRMFKPVPPGDAEGDQTGDRTEW